MVEQYNLDVLIHTVNSLQELGLNLDLPRIAVIGGQSAGKSSVLECIVGRDFLPRGTGMVTRRPLVLQLHQSTEEYAMINNARLDLGEPVRSAIMAETERELGKKMTVSSKEIILKIFSPKVFNLTLIDLPGMIKVPMKGQSNNVEMEILNMVSNYIKDDNTIILAVSPANQDLANSDGLKLAKEADPSGNRTIGVLTKLDLMDRGTDAVDLLNNKVLPLPKGYIGVVNRSQEDINNQKSMGDAAAAEREFFLTSPYSGIMNRNGIKYLQTVLHHELGNAIQNKIPHIENKLLKQKQRVDDELKGLGYVESNTQDTNIFRLIEKFKDRVNGKLDGEGREVDIEMVSQGAIINRKFDVDFNNIIRNPFYDSNNLDKNIEIACVNTHGRMVPLFVPEKAITIVVQSLLSVYETPLITCVTIIKAVLENLVEDSLGILHGYPVLVNELRKLVMQQIIKLEEDTAKHLKSHIKAQKAFVDLRQVHLTASSEESLKRKPHRIAPSPPPTIFINADAHNAPGLWKQSKARWEGDLCGESKIKEEAKEVKLIVGNYMEKVDATVRDMTQKYIMFAFVDALQDYVRDDLINDVTMKHNTSEDQESLLKWEENSRLTELLEKRDRLQDGLDMLSKLHN